MCKPGCDCKSNIRSMRFNLDKSQYRYETFRGRQHIVVPVILARADVVMNGALLPEDEYFPEAWNGVPVTVDHPHDETGIAVSANSPMILETYAVGHIFNAHVQDKSLRGEAWIDVDLANDNHPGLIEHITEEDTDVSTGYFSDDEKKQGQVNGVTFNEISRNLRPDHLALLPGNVGACSWADGCGIRANKEKKMVDDKEVKKPTGVTEEMKTFTEEDVKGIVANAVSEALKDHKPTLSPADQEAVQHAHKILGERKAELVTKVCANSRMSKEQAEKLDIQSLEMFLNSLPEPVADYSGRSLATNADEKDEIAEGMAQPSIIQLFANRAKK